MGADLGVVHAGGVDIGDVQEDAGEEVHTYAPVDGALVDLRQGDVLVEVVAGYTPGKLGDAVQ